LRICFFTSPALLSASNFNSPTTLSSCTKFSLLRKDIRLFLRNKVAFGLTFIVPIIMIYIFGQVFGGMGSSGSGPSGIPLALIFEEESTLASAITESLETESAFRIIKTWADDAGVEVPLTEARVRELIADN
tara:strand:- start:1272 stop:1667 length:396 start_codon:yes stop_codon:yes gene_type:complete